MAQKLTVKETADLNGYDLENEDDVIELMLLASVVPACCSSGCMVEPDGKCQHGFSAITWELF